MWPHEIAGSDYGQAHGLYYARGSTVRMRVTAYCLPVVLRTVSKRLPCTGPAHTCEGLRAGPCHHR